MNEKQQVPRIQHAHPCTRGKGALVHPTRFRGLRRKGSLPSPVTNTEHVMQDKPDLTPIGSTPAPVQPSRTQRVLYWFRCRRKTITYQIVRGVAYGIGAGGVSIIVWWIENH
jgi:hypothetical protein